jgi:hypothetical protein
VHSGTGPSRGMAPQGPPGAQEALSGSRGSRSVWMPFYGLPGRLGGPSRARLRPTSLDELPAGTVVIPGMATIAVRVADGARMRCFVKAPPHRRRDTDRNCESLLPGYAKAGLARLRTPAFR